MRTATPQKFGVRMLRELPDLLKQKDVKEILNIPEFDKTIVRESTHSPLEADLSLIKDNKVVAELSVKASTGNLDYIIKSWRTERRNLDLLAILPLEGRKNSNITYYVALIVVPKILRRENPARIRKYLLSVINAKREEEKLDRLWPTDFSEISGAIRDFELLRKQDEILRKQDELLKRQEVMIKKFDRIIEILEKIYEELKASK